MNIGYEAGEGLYTNMNAMRRLMPKRASQRTSIYAWPMGSWEKISFNKNGSSATVDYLQKSTKPIYGYIKI